MFRGNYRFFVLTAALIFGVLVAFTNVMAQESCEAPDVLYLPSEANWEWKVALKSVTPMADGTFEYLYSVEEPAGTTSGLDFFAITIPDCCPEAVSILPAVPNKTKIFDVGEGEPTIDFNLGNYQAFVVKYTPSPGAVDLKFKANSGRSGEASVALKVGKKNYYGEIKGPGCPAWAAKAVTTYSEVTLEDGLTKICIVEDPYSRCGRAVDCETGEELPKRALKELFADKENEADVTAVIAEGGDLKCSKFVIKSGEQSWYYYCSGGWCYYIY